jgi:hypothetical protein
MKTTNLADLYELPIIEWAVVEDRLVQGITQAPGTGGPDRHTTWLATINRDGSPTCDRCRYALVRRRLLV